FMVSYRALKHAETVKLQLDSETEAQIEDYLASGEPVAIPLNKKMIDKGSAMFGLGVLNVYNETKTFQIIKQCSQIYNAGTGAPSGVSCNTPDEAMETVVETFNLNSHESKKVAILVTPKQVSGLHAFIIKITCTNCQKPEYGDPQIIYVEVP
ncbi:unnamed protein product, partial [marine sediment metagenome]